MAGISGLLETGKRALLTYRALLNVTGHNISNVDTPGYSRQEAALEATTTSEGLWSAFGSGVRLSGIKRSYNRFLELQANQETVSQGRWKAIREAMEQAELIFNDISGQGLSSVMNEFWSAWQGLVNMPEGMPERLNLRERGEALVDAFNAAARDLNEMQRYANESMLATVSDINSLANRIARLNDNILAVEVSGQQANDLRDQRDLLLRELSDKVETSYFEAGDGSVNVYVAGGRTLVDGNRATQLNAVRGPGGLHSVDWVGLDGGSADVTATLRGGALGGWIEVRDSIIPRYRSNLDALASSLIKEVNRLHSGGIGLSTLNALTSTEVVSDWTAPLSSQGSGLPFYSEIGDGSFQVWVYDSSGALSTSVSVDIATTTSLQALKESMEAIPGISTSITSDGRLKIDALSGWSFHVSNDTSGVLMALGLNTMFTGSSASGIGLNSSIMEDLKRIAAVRAADGSELAAGNGLNALLIAGLQDSLVMEGDTISMSSYYRSMVTSIGMDSVNAEYNMDQQEAILNQLNNRRLMISGVSLDEEMTDLLEYANAYAAAGRLIATAGDMLDILLGLLE